MQRATVEESQRDAARCRDGFPPSEVVFLFGPEGITVEPAEWHG